MAIDVRKFNGVNLSPSRQTADRGMVRTETVNRRSSFGDFLEGLGKLNPAVQELGNSMMAVENDPQKKRDEIARVNFQTMGKSAADIASMDTTGMTEGQRRALELRKSGVLAVEIAQKMQQDAAMAPPGTYDVDASFAKYRQQVQDAGGGNSSFERGFYETMNPMLDQMRQGNFKLQVGEELKSRAMVVSSAFNAAIGQIQASKPGDNAALVAGIGRMVKENKDYLGMGLEEQAAVLQQTVSGLSLAGNPDAIKSLGELDINGKKLKDIMGPSYQQLLLSGQNRLDDKRTKETQPFILDADYAAQIGTLQPQDAFKLDQLAKQGLIPRSTASGIVAKNRASIERGINAELQESKRIAGETWLNAVQPDLVQSVVDGNFDVEFGGDTDLPQADGTSVTVQSTRKEERAFDSAVNQMVRYRIGDKQVSDQEKAAITADVKIDLYARNNKLPKDIKASAENVLGRSNPGLEITDADRRGAADLVRISKYAPGLADDVIKSEKDKAFYFTLTTLGRTADDLDDVIRHARVARDTYDQREPLSTRDMQTIVDGVKEDLKIDVERWGLLPDSTSDWKNDMDGAIRQTVRGLQNAGLQGNALKEAVTNSLKASTTKYNGHLISTDGLPLNDPSKLNAMLDVIA
jgi:hypothetical protein